jgi:hypothetical protein
MLALERRAVQTVGMVANGRPKIDVTGARMKANGNGPGYSPPSARDGEPRFGQSGSMLIDDPFEFQSDTDFDGDDD